MALTILSYSISEKTLSSLQGGIHKAGNKKNKKVVSAITNLKIQDHEELPFICKWDNSESTLLKYRLYSVLCADELSILNNEHHVNQGTAVRF